MCNRHAREQVGCSSAMRPSTTSFNSCPAREPAPAGDPVDSTSSCSALPSTRSSPRPTWAGFIVLTFMQWSLRRPVARAYLENHAGMTNRVTAHGYTAWDNIFSGNRFTLRLWFRTFKARLRECLRAQSLQSWRAKVSGAAGGIIGLAIVFTVMTMIAVRDVSDTEVLIALAGNAAPPDRDDARRSGARQRLERLVGGLDPDRRHCRQRGPAARSKLREPHQVRSADAARGRADPRLHLGRRRPGLWPPNRRAGSRFAAATARASRRCSRVSRPK